MSRKQKDTGKSIASFRALHDKSVIFPAKIRAGLKSLGNAWEYEADFIKRCGLSQPEFGRYRDQFSDFFVSVRERGSFSKRAWAGTKKYADQMRAALS